MHISIRNKMIINKFTPSHWHSLSANERQFMIETFTSAVFTQEFLNNIVGSKLSDKFYKFSTYLQTNRSARYILGLISNVTPSFRAQIEKDNFKLLTGICCYSFLGEIFDSRSIYRSTTLSQDREFILLPFMRNFGHRLYDYYYCQYEHLEKDIAYFRKIDNAFFVIPRLYIDFLISEQLVEFRSYRHISREGSDMYAYQLIILIDNIHDIKNNYLPLNSLPFFVPPRPWKYDIKSKSYQGGYWSNIN